MSRFLRALAYVAPDAALKRARAARALDALHQTRGYDGAKIGRRAASFNGRGTSANGEIGSSLNALRDRSRDLVRNTPHAARVLDIIVSHAVGTGITARWDTGSDRINRQFKAMWDGFCRRSDVEGQLDFYGQQALALRSMLESGESLVRMIPRPLGEEFPLRLQVVESDVIDTTRNGRHRNGYARLGVEVGEYAERLGYWLFDQHPGEAIDGAGGMLSARLASRNDLVHLYRPTRPGQMRGAPLLAPVIMTARDLADLMDAMVVKTRIEACLTGFITSPSSDIADVVPGQVQADLQEQVATQLEPGAIFKLNTDEDIKFVAPSGTGQFEPVMLAALMAFAAGAGITYDQLTGDLRQANYSSLRAGKIEFRRQIEQLQWHVLVPMFLQRVADRFLAVGEMSNRLTPRMRTANLEWVMPGVEPIDPRKDLEADILAVRAGRMSPQEFIGSWGRDWEQVISEHASFLAMLDEKGLVLDIDPRRTTQAGASQSTYASDPPAVQAS